MKFRLGLFLNPYIRRIRERDKELRQMLASESISEEERTSQLFFLGSDMIVESGFRQLGLAKDKNLLGGFKREFREAFEQELLFSHDSMHELHF